MIVKPTADYQTYKLNIYQTIADTKALNDLGIEVESKGGQILIFDAVKLALYTIFFGQRLFRNIKLVVTQPAFVTGSDIFNLTWNALISFFNISNFVMIMILSKSYDVNELLRKNEYFDSHALMSMYSLA